MSFNSFVTYLVKFVFLIFITSCQNESHKSVIILSFEHLPSSAINCSDDFNNENSGFKILCKEFTRFTHAYTPSLQPAAATASILTGLHPLDHKLFRSYDQIVNKNYLAQEHAKKLGYRTALFSGSPHILKKTGLSHYFDLYDDSAGGNYSQQLFKNFKTLSDSLIDWIEESSTPFFVFLSSSELNSISDKDTNTTNLEKLDEALFTFIQQLKVLNKWDDSYIILTGLNGVDNYNRIQENEYTNLHSENTQVALFVKTPRMKGDDGISWKNDNLISLSDIGYSLNTIFKSHLNYSSADESGLNLFELINTNKISTAMENRFFTLVSSQNWASDLQLSIAFVNNENLFINEKSEYVKYNLLTDQFEENPIRLSDDEKNKINQELMNIKSENDIKISYQKNYSFLPEPTIDYIKKLLTNSKIKNEVISENSDCFFSKKETITQRLIYRCKDLLHRDFLTYKYAKQLNLNEEKEKLNYTLNKKRFFEELKIQQINYKLQNIWGIYDINKKWVRSVMYEDSQFFKE